MFDNIIKLADKLPSGLSDSSTALKLEKKRQELLEALENGDYLCNNCSNKLIKTKNGYADCNCVSYTCVYNGDTVLISHIIFSCYEIWAVVKFAAYLKENISNLFTDSDTVEITLIPEGGRQEIVYTISNSFEYERKV